MPGSKTLTNQYLSFAFAQLNILEEERELFRQRAIKHALITQSVFALLSYLEELELKVIYDSFSSPLLTILKTTLEKAENDFRIEDLSAELTRDKSWLRQLLQLHQDSHSEKRIQQKNEAEISANNNLIRVQDLDEQEKVDWWKIQTADLSKMLKDMQAFIDRQRSTSHEE